MVTDLSLLKVKLFSDGADKKAMIEMASKPYIKGLTTNPTLMRKAGVQNYRLFAKEILTEIRDKPISFEVFSDDLAEMKSQALEIASWAENVYVKVPITNSMGVPTTEVIAYLSSNNVKLNITAILTSTQVAEVISALNPRVSNYISVFAGRIADTGVDPIPMMKDCLKLIAVNPMSELIWASPRELLNIFQADEIGCHIITATSDILNKLNLIGKDLTSYSLDTVKMFRNDAVQSGFEIDIA
jgi:transaldolase